MDISRKLQQWYEIHKRDLPWRDTNSPYHIWLSEIILQQTRVAQGLEYYLKFTGKYPRIEDLANASLDEVLKLWQGLGYYTRARNLHTTAKYIASAMNGSFPRTYKELVNLKGIGKYTAAAIASIAFREPVAVVDGNVYRVISRIFGIELAIDTVPGKSEFSKWAAELLDKKNPHIHNQAMMELGAMICLPKNPRCPVCPLASECIAFKTEKIAFLPVKSCKRIPRERYFHYLFIENKGYTWLNQRMRKDIWHSLYEFPLIETRNKASAADLTVLKEWKDILGTMEAGQAGPVKYYKHQLTHQTIHCNFYHVKTDKAPSFAGRPFVRAALAELDRYAIPRLIEKYLADLNQNDSM